MQALHIFIIVLINITSSKSMRRWFRSEYVYKSVMTYIRDVGVFNISNSDEKNARNY